MAFSRTSKRPRRGQIRLTTLAAAAALTIVACSSSAATQSTFTAQSSATEQSPATVRTSPADGPGPLQGSVSSTQLPSAVSGTGCKGLRGKTVSSAAGLHDALATASPGTVILLSPGTYPDKFSVTASGTAAYPITLCGPRTAVLDGGSIASGYTFHLDHANWWRIEGFTVTGGQKGVMADHSDHDLIAGLYVHNIGDEAIHLREFSSYDTVSGVVIRDTGLYSSKFGEGIYVGTANKNWCRYTACQPDASDYDVIVGNNIARTTAENVDIKEGTFGGRIVSNYFNGTGMTSSAATSWVNVKGNGWRIFQNTGIDSVGNGLSDHQVYAGWGVNNVFADNKLTVNGPGYGIYIQSKRLHDAVACSNKVSGAAKGYANQACTPGSSR
jgi:hypothetical protein